MPMYEYKCQECHHTWEEIHSWGDSNSPLDKECPECKMKECIYKCMAVNLHHSVINPHKKMDHNFKEEMKRIKSEHPEGFKNSTYF